MRSAPFPKGSFDVVTCFHVLEHVPDPVAVTRRMVEWLAPGGLLVIEVPNAGGLIGLKFPGCRFTNTNVTAVGDA